MKPMSLCTVLATTLLFGACTPSEGSDLDDSLEGFPNYEPTFTVMADSDDQVRRPQDLEFHPDADRNDELWVVNRGTEDTGSDMVIVHDAGTSEQTTERRIDSNAWHFMNLSSAIAFSEDNGNWANSPEVTDANHSGGTFTGPSLWSSNLDIFAMPSAGNGSHIDMIHQSPNAMGIAHEVDNIFWVFDGYANELVRYGFGQDHGPGNADHSDGKVKRYSTLPLSRVEGVPGHMVLDKSTDWLYICDPGNSQVLRMDVTSGSKEADLPPNNEQLANHVQMKDEVWEVFAGSGLTEPSGVALDGDTLYVSDHATGEIVAFDLTSGDELGRIQTPAERIMGLEIGPQGMLWYVDRKNDVVVRIDQG